MRGSSYRPLSPAFRIQLKQWDTREELCRNANLELATWKSPPLDTQVLKTQQPKELLIVEGATHIDLYDKPKYVTPAVAKLKEFFDEALK